ncbi:hypothetical protein BDY19DRAFT_995857 [Irpex rosettiformis]|uniref:Uncharacterized protein n=1 Tax=Irpex rosettiformis TaxID=378272 RepID=A0ACB8TX78_9APHY|nr:hypothetical protein BDY19DRAFT_995857 [Irpex rosettiformis]
MSGLEAKEKGNAAFKSGDFAGAIGHYTAAILADPKNATYPLNRAAAYLKLGKNEDADRDCTRVIELDSRNVKGWFRRGQARASLNRLEDAKQDFERVLQLDPQNDASQQEVKKVVQAIQERNSKLKNKIPIDVNPSSPSSSDLIPRRRRVPITIVDSDMPPPSSSLETVRAIKKEDLLQPVSSRSLEKTQSPPPSEETNSTPGNTASTPKKPATFKEAKQAREAQKFRSGGGIFRRDGQHTLFDAHPRPATSPVPSPKTENTPPPNASSPPLLPPSIEKSIIKTSAEPTKPRTVPSLVAAASAMTLFNFNRNWDSLKTPEARWDFLQQIPPSSLPSLFKTSLEASNVVSILQTLRHVLQHTSLPQDTKHLIQEYLVSLARVSRFNTVVLFMSADERRLAREVWTTLEDGVVADSPERKAWGLL